MAGNNNDDSDIRRLLDMPSSELGIDNVDFSDDEWFDDLDADPDFLPGGEDSSDVVDDPEPDFQPNGEDYSDVNQGRPNVISSDDSEHDILGPSTSKQIKLGTKTKRVPKRKISKSKQTRNRKTTSSTTKYPHVWTQNNFVPTNFTFDNSNSGMANNNTDMTTELEFLEILLSDEIVDYIVQETNKQFLYIVNNSPPSDKSRLKQWLPLTNKEFRVFLATTMLMVHGKKNDIDDYWSNDPLLKNSSVSSCMSRDRYANILRLLHFTDNTLPPAFGRLTKIKHVVDMFRNSFSKSFIPFRNLCIDESLLLFKGQLGFKQFIPSKRSRFGIKSYLLCDCETGYVLDLIIYTGKDSEIVNSEDLGTSGAIITTLMTNYLNKGHCLFVDNWYTSPDLFTFLYNNQTNACGTARADRKGMPTFEKKLQVGETEVVNDSICMAVRWIDKRQVLMLTTEHNHEMVNTGKINKKTKTPIIKPKCVHDYNSNMGAVDRSDMMIVNIESVRRTTRWYKKLFLHLFDISILNAHALYLCKTGKKPTLPEFHLELVRQMLEKYLEPRTKKKGGRPSGDNPMRLTQRHFPALIPATEKKAGPCRPCVVCKYTERRERKRRESRYMCAECDVALCAAPCFAEFHQLKSY